MNRLFRAPAALPKPDSIPQDVVDRDRPSRMVNRSRDAAPEVPADRRSKVRRVFLPGADWHSEQAKGAIRLV
jgi:hypothetical protein